MGRTALEVFVLMLLATATSAGEAYEWAVEPSIPGADLPVAGASLFDRITTGSDGRQRIPYPFEALVARVEAAAGCDEHSCTRSVLIPLGRSLQRMAATPDFFAHPRVVTAVVGEGDGQLLRDRLYLGFQRQANVIEVISYNEMLGRFEFQIVRNYAAGQTPQAVYARRTMCLSCHQNHGPIFSQQVWLETNANPAIAAKLGNAAKSFAGVDARGNTDIAQSIDDATDRANRLALTQRLWRDGCGRGGQGDRCRRAAFGASLQLALSGGRSYQRSGDFQTVVARTVAANAQAHWPSGIAIANPDIPNRDPLAVAADVVGAALAAVEVRFDPLVPRAPLDVLSASDSGRLTDALVNGLAAFWSQRDRNLLLIALDVRAAPRNRVRLPCRISGSPAREQFDCGEAGGKLHLKGALDGARGTIDQIGTDDASIRHLPVRVQRQGGGITLTPLDSQTGRLADGNLLQRVVLQSGEGAAAQVDMRQDFEVLASFIERMTLDAGTIRSSMLGDLVAVLNGKQIVIEEFPTPTFADTYSAVPASADVLVRALESQCGSCHHTQEPVPPNFLSGDAKQVAAAIESCAPRIYVRLAMRDLPEDQRDRSPMPPDTLAGGKGIPTADDRALVELRAAIEAQLHRKHGERPSAARLLERGYEALPQCLPAAGRETLQ